METKGKSTLRSTLKADVENAQAVRDAISMAWPQGEVEVTKLEPKEPYYLTNKELKGTYEQMHSQGPSAWFNDGKEERKLILKLGEPWLGIRVLEIGCGEGELADMMFQEGASVTGIDYSKTAIQKAQARYPVPLFVVANWQDVETPFDRVIMQGVLEHFDDPWGDLDRIIEKFKPKTIITSSPCFLNPRGIVWMTLHMLGAVMSKTDLHFLNPWEFADFCDARKYRLWTHVCDRAWSHGNDLIPDLKQRIPLALRDGKIPWQQEKLDEFLKWLEEATSWMPYIGTLGATAVYRIDL